MQQNLTYFTFIASLLSNAYALETNKDFKLQQGDLLFQDLNCGVFCDSIDSVTYGYKNTYMSHVAMVINVESAEPQLIQAVSSGVAITPLAPFLAASRDNSGNPRVIVGRLQQPYQKLIPSAISYTIQQVGKPYNASFIPALGNSFYCSELIAEAFKYANNGTALFHTHPMNFMDKNHQWFLPLWENYYHQLQITPPQGVAGTNPGAMSQESILDIVYYYGQLRQHQD